MTKIKHTMMPARAVVDALDGCRPLARAIKLQTGGAHTVTASAISRWMRPAELSGTNGRVPLKHWGVILAVADKAGKHELIERLLHQHAKVV